MLPLTRSYGGVVMASDRRVLLREPSGHFGGCVWTFAKGRPEPGESPEDTAVREVLEETGWRASIVARIPGDYLGAHTISQYFLMRPVEMVSDPGFETSLVLWVSRDEARRRIALSSCDVSRRRDLLVMEQAFSLATALPNRSAV